ncbi:MAG TPA: cupin domain-containing protein [Cytophagales bacterium]|jgi:quercetin dioxygenase-like cupin family protein|nr:cupin domain-containing protein [Cytophagales bacterium]
MPFVHEKNLKPVEIVPGFLARFVHTENLTIAYVEVKSGSILPEHEHPQEQITHVLEGQLELTVGGETQIAEAGKIVMIPSNVKHSAIARSYCKVMDVFSPVREDYKALEEKTM